MEVVRCGKERKERRGRAFSSGAEVRATSAQCLLHHRLIYFLGSMSSSLPQTYLGRTLCNTVRTRTSGSGFASSHREIERGPNYVVFSILPQSSRLRSARGRLSLTNLPSSLHRKTSTHALRALAIRRRKNEKHRGNRDRISPELTCRRRCQNAARLAASLPPRRST